MAITDGEEEEDLQRASFEVDQTLGNLRLDGVVVTYYTD